MIEPGIRLEHFELLERYGGKPATRSAEHLAARERMREPYRATRAWAEALKAKVFPRGRTEGRLAVINQGQHFSRYTWWRIYPRQSSPQELAYTVGIDQSGQFIVKLDTYQPTSSLQNAYLGERGPSNVGSPFAGVMSAEEGVELSFEALVDWSADEIARFQPDYDELAARIGLSGAGLKLISDPEAVRTGLENWHEGLLGGAILRNGIHLVPEGPLVVRTRPIGGLSETELGHDPSGKRWLVRINEAREPQHADRHRGGQPR